MLSDRIALFEKSIYWQANLKQAKIWLVNNNLRLSPLLYKVGRGDNSTNLECNFVLWLLKNEVNMDDLTPK